MRQHINEADHLPVALRRRLGLTAEKKPNQPFVFESVANTQLDDYNVMANL